ncbi:GILT-like protein 1 [Dermacentor andersoni]|uniref:GILT-like protein 1 n=1 Tax=Dermacentor andersoni TaxID=34620 RepID=UPI003B3A7303
MGGVCLLCSLLLSLLACSPCLGQAQSEPVTALLPSAVKKVNLTVLYEPYSKESSWFINKQLVPMYRLLRKHLVVDMVPFGGTHIKEPQVANTTVSFTCRHGQAECQASMIHACAIALYPDPDKHLPFISCTLMSWKPEKNAQKCSNEHKLESSRILGCASSEQGRILLQKMGRRTMSVQPPINRVPSVVIDGGFNKRYQKELQEVIKATVCKHFKPPVPEPCLVKKRRGWFWF